jgi:hypothetical protein
MRTLGKIIVPLLLAGTLAGCIVYDGPYPAYRPYQPYYYQSYGFHDRPFGFRDHDGCWNCGRRW